ncbi:hypothetical protein [Algoriphagus sp.]|uniref:hypothetical protein n=1 Tax=Algoriphagus sp. TaxID=1872435 RepID=UPI003F6E8E7F
MENNFEDIQKLWQEQKTVEFDLKTLISGMKKTEQKQRRELIFMLIITPLTIGFLFLTMPWQESPGIEVSLYLIAFAMIWVLAMALSSKIKRNEKSERFSNTEYLKTQIKKLNYRYQIAKRYMYGYTFLLLLALNICYFILLEPLSALVRIGIHLALTVLIGGFMHWQMRKKVATYDQELIPMIEQMKGMLERKGY